VTHRVRLGLILLTLSACQREPVEPTPPPPAAPPIAAPPVTPPWQLGFDAIGAVRVGMRVADAESLAGTARVERIEPGDRCGDARFANVPAGISFMLDGTTIVRIDILEPGITTREGIAIGSTEADALARYAGTIRVEPHHYTGPEGHYLIVEDPAHPAMRLLFETDGMVVTAMRSGRRAAVELVEGCA
jgi:hypothetical protein